MSKSTVDIILSLPTAISCEILSVWLYVPSLVRLDSAYCNHNRRPFFVALYQQPELVCSLAYCPRRIIGWIIDRKIRLNEFDVQAEVQTDVAEAYLAEFGQSIRTLQLADDAGRFSLIEAAAINCPNVDIIYINPMNGASAHILQCFPNLHRLQIYLASISEYDGQTVLSKLRNMRKLSIICDSDATIKDVLTIVDLCPIVTHFSLSICFSPHTESAVASVSRLTSLISLNLGSLPVGDAAVSTIAAHCSSIVHIDVSRSDTITDAAVYNISRKLKLKSIALPSSNQITDLSLEHLHHCASTLQRLHIAQTMGYSVKTVKLTLPAIRALLVKTSNCKYSWNVFVLEFDFRMSLCANATTMIVSPNVTDANLSEIALHCNHMQHLDLYLASHRSRSEFTSAGLYSIIDSCLELKSICVCPKIDKARFADILTTHAKLFTHSIDKGSYDVMVMA